MKGGKDKRVKVSLTLSVDGNIIKEQETYYSRNRETSVFTLEQFARVILMWDRIFDSTGTTYAYDGLMQKMEKVLPSKTGDTAETLFQKYWIDFEKTIEKEFDKLNKGSNDTPFPEADDYLKFCIAGMCNGFQNLPLPAKKGFIYWFYEYAINDSLREIEKDHKIPKRIKKLVDNLSRVKK